MIAARIAEETPKVSAAQRFVAAHGIAALYANTDALSPLDPPDAWHAASKEAAKALLRSLKEIV